MSFSTKKRHALLTKYPQSHPVWVFLNEFISCQEMCIGIELLNDDYDHLWFSEIEQKQVKLSSFIYTYLAFDIELDGWLTNAPSATSSEQEIILKIPHVRNLIQECNNSAKQNNHTSVLPYIDRIINLLEMWEDCIVFRLNSIPPVQILEQD